MVFSCCFSFCRDYLCQTDTFPTFSYLFDVRPSLRLGENEKRIGSVAVEFASVFEDTIGAYFVFGLLYDTTRRDMGCRLRSQNKRVSLFEVSISVLVFSKERECC